VALGPRPGDGAEVGVVFRHTPILSAPDTPNTSSWDRHETSSWPAFTFLAALAALRSTAASEQITRRATEALARTLRPTLALDTLINPGIENALLVGRLMPTDGPPPVDVSMEWVLANGQTITGHASRVEPWRPDLPPGSDLSISTTLVDPAPTGAAHRAKLVERVVVHYSDEQRIGR
jgi:hypothetical protein